MLILVCGVLAVLSPALFGGDLRRLAMVRFRLVVLPVGALVAQIVIIEVVPDASRVVLEVVHLGTYVAAGLFIAANWRIPGLLVVAAGGALNGVTIALNGGTLPASLHALRAAGFSGEDSEFINSGVLPDPVLPILGDIFVWPAPLPLSNVYSFGDVLIVLGAAYGAHRIAGSRLVKRPWSPEETPGDDGDAGDRPTRVVEATEVDSPVTATSVGFAAVDTLSPLQQRLAGLHAPGRAWPAGAGPDAGGSC